MIDPLLDVPPDKAFWFCNSSRAMNIYQLLDIIKHTGDDIFLYHVAGEGRNDFAAWVLDVIEDKKLYYLLKDEKDKYWFTRKVEHRIKELESTAQQRISQR